jgi:DNA repair exonuclease SbcCD nuclease subunit
LILFTADWHIKLGQKNVPKQWALNRYRSFFDQVYALEAECSLHIIGGDIFDRVPSLEELELYFEFISGVNIPTLIYDGNHEATRKNKTFFSHLKKATNRLNSLCEVIDEIHYTTKFGILPYCELHKKGGIEKMGFDRPLFTHVRGSIPPHVKPEVDLERFKDFPIVYAGDLHAHSNTQLNIVYPGSPMTTSFHRNEVNTGYILIKEDNLHSWLWKPLELPQLIRKTVQDAADMIATPYHHTIYELEGDMQELADTKNSELLDKKVVKRNTEAALILDPEMTIQDELIEYLTYILELDESKVQDIVGVYNDCT